MISAGGAFSGFSRRESALLAVRDDLAFRVTSSRSIYSPRLRLFRGTFDCPSQCLAQKACRRSRPGSRGRIRRRGFLCYSLFQFPAREIRKGDLADNPEITAVLFGRRETNLPNSQYFSLFAGKNGAWLIQDSIYRQPVRSHCCPDHYLGESKI